MGMKVGSSVYSRMRWAFSLDLRSLALVRVLIGTVLLLDLWVRGPDVAIWLSDEGVLPRSQIIDQTGDYRWSLYLISGHWLWAFFLHACAALAAMAMILGYRARLSAFVSLILLASLHNRASILLQGGDNLLLLLVFWLCFLPIGARYSVDAALVDPRKPVANEGPNQYLSIAGVAILCQAMAVYFFSAFLKSGSHWYPDGTAIYFALHLDELTTPLAQFWRDELWLTRPLTLYVWWLELLGPILIFSPVFRLPLRLAMMFAFISLEVGFILNLRIGLFPLVSISSILLFMPTEVWDRIHARYFEKRGEGLTLYYDQGCEFCLKMCVLLRTFLFLTRAQIVPAQRDPRINAILDREFSWVVVNQKEETHIKWFAMVEVFAQSPVFFWLAPLLRLMDGLGTDLYEWVAENRGAFGRVFARWLPWEKAPPYPGRASAGMALFFALFVLFLNITTVPSWRLGFQTEAEGPGFRLKMPSSWVPMKRMFRLDQKWNMFAPYPKLSDSWIVIPGLTKDGELVNVFAPERELTFTKPSIASGPVYPNYRWRKYLTRIPDRRYPSYRTFYADWLCREWNSTAVEGNVLSQLNIYRMVETTQPPGELMQVERRLVGEYACADAIDGSIESALKESRLWDLQEMTEVTVQGQFDQAEEESERIE